MPTLNWKTVDRYFAGEATAAERQLVERWLAESEGFRRLVAELYRSELGDQAVRDASTDVQARLDERDIASPERLDRRQAVRRSGRVFPIRGIRALKAAAAIVLILGASLMIRQGGRRNDARHAGAALRTITAPAGAPLPVSFPDGSRAVLSPGSTLRYAVAFSAERRDVQLSGEAYFDVRHDARHPFVVRAGDLVAEDVGTEFVVRAYPEDPYGRVIVRAGLVGIGGAVVGPGQLGRLSPDGVPIVEPADTASWFAWTRGRLLFAGMPLRDAIPKLSRWYDLQFRLADSSLGDIKLVGDVPSQLDDETLEALGIILGVRLAREGRIVTLHAISADPS